jgi:hypothetical protein
VANGLFDIGAALLAGAMVYLAFQQKRTSAFIVLMAAAVAACFGSLDQILGIKAALGSLEITMRDAKNDVEQLKQMAALLGQSIIDGDRYAGALGGMPARIRDGHRASVLQILKSANVDQSIIDRINEQNYEHDVSDYAWEIDRVVAWVLKNDNKTMGAWNQAFLDAFVKTSVPTPTALRQLFQQFAISDAFALELLKDYEYFTAHREQRRPDVWADRDTWPGNQ